MATNTNAEPKRSKNAERMANRRAKRKNAGMRPFQVHLTAAACDAADDMAGHLTGSPDTVATARYVAQVLEDLLPALVDDDVVSLAEQQAMDGTPVSPSAVAAQVLKVFASAAAKPGMMARIAALVGPCNDQERQAEMISSALEIGLSVIECPSVAARFDAAQVPEEGRADVIGEAVMGLRVVEALQAANLLAEIARAPDPGAVVKDAVTLQQRLMPLFGSNAAGAVANLLWQEHTLAARQRLVAHVAEEAIPALYRGLKGMPQARESVAAAKTLRGVFDLLDIVVAAAPPWSGHPLSNLKSAFVGAANRALREGRTRSAEQFFRETLCHVAGVPLPGISTARSSTVSQKTMAALPAPPPPTVDVEAEEVNDEETPDSSTGCGWLSMTKVFRGR